MALCGLLHSPKSAGPLLLLQDCDKSHKKGWSKPGNWGNSFIYSLNLHSALKNYLLLWVLVVACRIFIGSHRFFVVGTRTL